MSARKGQREPGPEGFTWRGIKFTPPPGGDPTGFFSSEPLVLGEDGRSADWKVQRVRPVERRNAPERWAARLRIGAERYPGTGATHTEALHAAAGEAANVAAFIVAMLPPGGGLAGISELAEGRRSGSATPAARRKRRRAQGR